MAVYYHIMYICKGYRLCLISQTKENRFINESLIRVHFTIKSKLLNRWMHKVIGFPLDDLFRLARGLTSIDRGAGTVLAMGNCVICPSLISKS